MIAVRRAREQDWELVRAVRLAALQEAPEAFCSAYEREVEYAEHQWRSWAQGEACFLAMDEGAAVAMVAVGPTDAPETWNLVALWVAPTHRHQQVGRMLVDAGVTAARERGASRVVLGVMETNATARRFYAQCGFVTTGNEHSLPGELARGEPSQVELEMVLELGPPGADPWVGSWEPFRAGSPAVSGNGAATGPEPEGRCGERSPLRIAEFGSIGPMRERLVDLVMGGVKTAAASLAEEYEHDGEALPQAGDRWVVVDSAGVSRGVIETTSVEAVAFAEVAISFVLAEGEGFAGVEDWQRAHRKFWSGTLAQARCADGTSEGPQEVGIRDDALIVCERFRVVQESADPS